ncbi:MAG: DUF4412 domain-containing protein [Verrucomicrobia bacterium]|nr:DUF4412 domain-containing protein [Verrucomicrobiota bacterium]
MKTFSKLTGLLLLGLAPLLAPAASFEGRFNVRLQDDDGTRAVSCAMKAEHLRAEIPSDNGAKIVSLVDFGRKEISAILPGQPLYAVMSLDDAVAKLGDVRKGQGALQKTTETAVVLGYACVKYVAKSKEGVTEIWTAAALGSPLAGSAFQSLAHTPAERELLAQGGFPLRVIGRTPDGTAHFRMEVVSMEKQPLPDSFFAPPAGYQKIDVGILLRGGLNLFGGR